MNLESLLIIGFWLLPALIQLIQTTHYWQLKEYRIDRMLDFLRYDEGKILLTKPHNIGFYGILLITIGLQGLFGYPVANVSTIAASALVLGIQIWQIKKVGLRRPKLTKKAVLIILTTLIINLAIALLIQSRITLTLLLLVQPFIISFIVIVLIIPTKIAKLYFVKKAQQKIKTLNTINIGITGSFGKSSTKEFLAQILNYNNPTLKTPKNINTEIGVARLILNKLNDSYQYFVAEMGAYKQGEIKLLASMVKPSIGIITAVAPQHVTLFGSLEKIQKGKAELVQNLTANGTAILNYDNNLCREIGTWLPKTTEVHYFSINESSNVSCKILNLSKEDETWKIKVNLFGEHLDLSLSVPAQHLIQNLLPTLIAAKKLGLTNKQIIDAVNQITLSDSGFKKFKTNNGINVIDDSYNSNPNGFKAAIKELVQLPGQKYIVTMGMLELGEIAETAYTEIAKLIVEHNIHCFVTKEFAFKEFVKADQQLENDVLAHFTYVDNLKNLAKTVLSRIQSGDSILIENRVPNTFMRQLKQ